MNHQSAEFRELLRARNSVRAFTNQPVPQPLLMQILEDAARAPSGTNIQPWQVYVLQGEKKRELSLRVCQVHDELAIKPELAAEYPSSYEYYPKKWFDPYLARRRENGWSLYGLLGIQKGEKQKMHQQHQRNFHFFDAPVGLIFTVHKDLGIGSFLDYGMFLQNLMLSAQSHGLSSCAQGAWVSFAKIVMPFIGAGEDELLVCGMALGYADTQAAVNSLRTPRQAAGDFVRFV
jgi:nitroreductase